MPPDIPPVSWQARHHESHEVKKQRNPGCIDNGRVWSTNAHLLMTLESDLEMFGFDKYHPTIRSFKVTL
jgi:hypothetical protein